MALATVVAILLNLVFRLIAHFNGEIENED
jgi:xanthine/uracil permease